MKTLLYSTLTLMVIMGGPGCGKEKSSSSSPVPQPAEAPRAAPVNLFVLEAQEGEHADPAQQVKAAGDPAISRKIKYAAVIHLITLDFAKAEGEVAKLVQNAQGYVAASEIKVSPGSIRIGYWKARIPHKEFDSFRTAVLKLGEVEKNATDSQDLTEEHYDLENNIKNRQAEEEALRKLMDKAADKMENFLAVRRELNEVRADIDRKLGRLKLLANLTDLTTVSLTVQEKQKYVPDKGPDASETPTFGRRVSKTLGDSAGGLLTFFQTVALVLAALVPWSPLVLTGIVPVWIYVRRQQHAQPATAGPNIDRPHAQP
jgi:hypothetical protein